MFDQIAGSADFESEYLPLLRRVSYNGGYFRALNIFYAGECPPNESWAKGLWPHKGGFGADISDRLTVEVDGSTKRFASYQVTSIGSELVIGTFCHEKAT